MVKRQRVSTPREYWTGIAGKISGQVNPHLNERNNGIKAPLQRLLEALILLSKPATLLKRAPVTGSQEGRIRPRVA